jgi:anti-sigma factor RsiW
MNSCSEIRNSIGPWLDGELSSQQADAIRAHLDTCLECSEERRQLEKIDRLMRDALESEYRQLDANAFWPGLRQRIAVKRPWYRGLAEWTVRPFEAPSFAWVVPAAIVLLIGALYFGPVLPAWRWGAPRNNFATVESIDAYGRNVALWRENESKTTVIWIYQNPESESEGPGETNDKGPAF